MLKGLDESLARFYVGSIVLALEYLHAHNIGGWAGEGAEQWCEGVGRGQAPLCWPWSDCMPIGGC